MKILILGGTYFLGKCLVEKLIQKEIRLTLLNRGTKNPFPELETIKADRHNAKQIKKELKGKRFDIVIDICGYALSDVKTIVDNLDCKIKHYIFISSTAVKCKKTQYGKDKFEIEQFLLKQKGFKVSIIRPTYIYGKDDYNQRTKYILDRINKGKIIRIKGNGKNLIRFENVDEVALNIIKIINNKKNKYPKIFSSNKKPIKIEEFIKTLAKGEKYKIKYNSKAKQTVNLPTYNYY
ncbi:MAG: NAD-dependent epimerase/dehydratase family protein [Patescibacteria group bacterium]